jgi:mRNA interferase MazF
MATSKAKLAFGDIVVVPFPYADKLAEKRRPAIVVSDDHFNAKQTLVWVAMITSASQRPWPTDIPLPLGSTALTAESMIRISKMATIEQSRIIRVLGTADRQTIAATRKALQQIIG